LDLSVPEVGSLHPVYFQRAIAGHAGNRELYPVTAAQLKIRRQPVPGHYTNAGRALREA